MRIARFTIDGSDPLYGIVEGDGQDATVQQIQGDPFFQGIHPTSTSYALSDVRLLAPIIPRSKVVCIGKNYEDHAAEMGTPAPKINPLVFLKPNTAVVGPGDPVTLPSFSEEIGFEAEMAVVIGRMCKDVPLERVNDVIFGYTIGSDLTARDVQRVEEQWTRAKGWDGSCPLGPWIETDLDPDNLRITGSLDGTVYQDSSTSLMIFSVAEIVSFASSVFTLLPGDVILTGTPAGIGLVTEGSTFTASVEGIGELKTTFRR